MVFVAFLRVVEGPLFYGEGPCCADKCHSSVHSRGCAPACLATKSHVLSVLLFWLCHHDQQLGSRDDHVDFSDVPYGKFPAS